MGDTTMDTIMDTTMPSMVVVDSMLVVDTMVDTTTDTSRLVANVEMILHLETSMATSMEHAGGLMRQAGLGATPQDGTVGAGTCPGLGGFLTIHGLTKLVGDMARNELQNEIKDQ